MKRSIGLLLLATACGPLIPVTDLKSVPPDLMERALQVQVALIGFPNPPNTEAYLGQVQGNSCKSLLTDPPPTRNDALLRLRIAAAKLGANAVVDTACDDFGTDALGTNCWASYTCKGTAVRVR